MQFVQLIVVVTLAEAARGRMVQTSEASEAGAPLLSQLMPLVRVDAAQSNSKALARAEVLSPAPLQRVVDLRGGAGSDVLDDLEDALQMDDLDFDQGPASSGASGPGAPLDTAAQQMQQVQAMLEDPEKMAEAMQEMETAMQQMLQDPETVQQNLQANPMIQEMAKTNPEVAAMLEDPSKFQAFAQQTVKQMEGTRAAMEQMQAMMSDPEAAEKSLARIEEAVAQMKSDPSRMQEMLQANPMIQQLAAQDPQVQAMLEDPDQVGQLGQMLTSQLEMIQDLIKSRS